MELRETNRGKKGRRFVYPESFMEVLGYCRLYIHLPFRQTEGLVKAWLKWKTKVPTYSAIWKRVNRLHIKMNSKLREYIVIAIDVSEVKVADRGDR